MRRPPGIDGSAAASRIEVDPDADGTDSTDVDERRLILRYRNGDQDAFASFVAVYRAPVYGYLVRNAVPERDRDDLFQEIFLRIHAAAATYRAELPVHPWVFTIVANAVRTYRRKRRLRGLLFFEPREPEGRETVGARAEAERAAAARQTLQWLEAEIPKLPRAHREALLLVAVEGMSVSDAAAVLAIPLGTVKTHVRRARMRLAVRLARHTGRPCAGLGPCREEKS